MDTIETYMLVDGEYRMVRVTADQILNRNDQEKQKKKVPPPKPPEAPVLGLLSTTLVHSPIINKILPARIRGTEFNDLLFVGENFIHIIEIQQDGHLQYIGTKSDFGSRIRAAAVVGRRVEDQDEPYLPFIKREKLSSVTDNKSSMLQTVSPQMLVVSLESGELRILFAQHNHTVANLVFFESSTSLPLASSTIQQPGKHLAVDPRARAIAVAAMNGTLIIYKLKCRERIEEEFRSDPHSWQPIEEDFPMPFDGIIMQMEFLTPAPDDNDHAILVVIVNTEPHVCRIVCYNFDMTKSFHLHPETEKVIDLRLDHEYTPTNLIIPTSYSPNFLIVSGHKIALWQNAFTSMPTIHVVSSQDPLDAPKNPASSTRLPVYTAWTKGERHHKKWKEDKNEVFFLVQEDGMLHQLTSEGESTFVLSRAGTFACNVSTAFTSFLANDKYKDPDFLIVAGHSSSGQVLQIGTGAVPQDQPAKKRSDVMKPQHIEWIPNWAPVLDMCLISEGTPTNQNLGRSTICMTSGTQPYGAISELRIGVEARINLSVQLMEETEMPGFTGIWAIFPETEHGQETLFVLSAPNETMVLQVGDTESIQSIEGLAEPQQETMFVVVFNKRHILHVTTSAIYFYLSIEDSECIRLLLQAQVPLGDSIVAVSYLEAQSALLVAFRQDERLWLQLYNLTVDSDGIGLQPYHEKAQMESHPTAMKLFYDHKGFGAWIGLSSEHLELFRFPPDGPPKVSTKTGAAWNNPNLVALIESFGLITTDPVIRSASDFLILCGRRAGNLLIIHAAYGPSEGSEAQNDDDIYFVGGYEIPIGVEPVRILEDHSSLSSMAILICGSDICRLKYLGRGMHDLWIDNIWLTDHAQPDLAQPTFSAAAYVSLQYFHRLELPLLIGTSGSSLLVADLEGKSKPIMRRMALEQTDEKGASLADSNGMLNEGGTPRQVLLLQSLQLLVVATTIWELRPHPQLPLLDWKGRRVVRGAIKFIQPDDPMASATQEAFKLVPGERITTMAEWPIEDLGLQKDTVAILLIVGTAYTCSDAQIKGRLFFLKIWLNKQRVPCLKVLKSTRLFDDGPIRAVTPMPRPKRSDPHATESNNVTAKPLAGPNSSDIGSKCDGQNKFNRRTTFRPRFALALEDQLDIYELLEREAEQDDSTGQRGSKLKIVRTLSTQLQSKAWRMSCPTDGLILVSTVFDSVQAYVESDLGAPQPPSLHHIWSDNVARQSLDYLDLDHMILVSDKSGNVAGLLFDHEKRFNPRRTLFKASMPQAIIKFLKGDFRPPWRRTVSEGVLDNKIIGAATDGSFYGFSILDEPALLMLKFLENLCIYHKQGSEARVKRYHGDPIVIDPELQRKGMKKDESNHVNGDTLKRFLGPDGEHLLLKMLQERHWEDGATAGHFGNEVKHREEKFVELAGRLVRLGNGDVKNLHDAVAWVSGWLRVILLPAL